MELLAPAGNYKGFLGAIHAGADAVYLGGEKFGARAYADNFSREEICQAIFYAHLFDRKVYLTVNTLLKDTELSELAAYLAPFYEAGLDGVIVQDIGAFCLIRDSFPQLKLHVSTQMTVTGSYAAGLLKEMGAVRIVPARELSLKEIEKIKRDTGLELETFIHGAMCYCYSGQCLFSSILGGRSGNRGRCAQPCRLPYQITESGGYKKEAYPLSLKDLCSISFLPKLIEAGIDSFKIEGRMKKPEYAAGVTAVYRKYIDLYYEKGVAEYTVERNDLEALSNLYVRSKIQDGYYFKRNGADMVTLSSSSYNSSDDSLLSAVRERYLDAPLRKKIKMEAAFRTGEKAALTCSGMGEESDVTVTVYGNLVEKANKQPITEENIKSSLQKLGNTFFYTEEGDILVSLSKDAFYPLKEINILRRQGIEALTNAFCAGQRPAAKEENEEKICLSAEESGGNRYLRELSGKTMKEEISFHIVVSTRAQLDAVLHTPVPVEILYLESDMQELTADKIRSLKKKFAREGRQVSVFIALPYIIREKDITVLHARLPLLQAADGCLLRNMEAVKWLEELHYNGRLRTDAGIYCFNQASLNFWLARVEGCCLPYELNKKEYENLSAGIYANRLEKAVYGRIPLMITANCIAKTCGQCGAEAETENRIYHLKDRYQKEFPALVRCRHCYNVIYNAVPLSLHEAALEGKISHPMRLDFTVETGEETSEILQFFVRMCRKKQGQTPYQAYTLGHERRGVE